jgi:hypothetical protein
LLPPRTWLIWNSASVIGSAPAARITDSIVPELSASGTLFFHRA